MEFAGERDHGRRLPDDDEDERDQGEHREEGENSPHRCAGFHVRPPIPIEIQLTRSIRKKIFRMTRRATPNRRPWPSLPVSQANARTVAHNPQASLVVRWSARITTQKEAPGPVLPARRGRG